MSSPGCKNILRALRLTAAPNQWLSRTVPFRQEGRIARRHERGTGCSGRESVRRATAVAGRAQLVSEFQRARRTTLVCRRPNRVDLTPVAAAKFTEAKPARPGSMSL